MIMASDGDPAAPSNGTISGDQSRWHHGDDGGGRLARPGRQRDAAEHRDATGGKYYVVNNAKALPKIFQREARRIARPLVYEPNPPVSPQITTQHEIVQGLGNAFPPVSGFVLTSVKENSLVDVVLTSPLPTESQNSTILATWTYGLGKSVAFTTDAGQRWATRMDRLGGIRSVLQPDGALVDAADRRHGQVHGRDRDVKAARRG